MVSSGERSEHYSMLCFLCFILFYIVIILNIIIVGGMKHSLFYFVIIYLLIIPGFGSIQCKIFCIKVSHVIHFSHKLFFISYSTRHDKKILYYAIIIQQQLNTNMFLFHHQRQY